MALPTKNSVLDDFPLCPQGLPPEKLKILFLLSSPLYLRIAGQADFAEPRLLQCTQFAHYGVDSKDGGMGYNRGHGVSADLLR